MEAPGSKSETADAARLVISIDVGTTQSAVALAYLPSGEPPLIDSVDQWPGQESSMHIARVPTAVLYGEKGNLLACGADVVAAKAGNKERSRGQPQHFKMQLHSPSKPPTKKGRFHRDRGLVPLENIYADYLSYLLKRTQVFLRERTGRDVWSSLKDRAEIVISHPNRWGTKQQKFLEEAVIQAGFVTREGAKQYLHFVEEAEAAASFALTRDVTLDLKFENGAKFVVCDAGGSTVDISAYVVTSRTGDRFDVEELDIPSCLDAGGVHVDKELSMHLYEQLFMEPDIHDLDVEDVHEIVDDGLNDFREDGKQNFSSPTDSLKVKIGGRRMDHPKIQVTRGVMNIEPSKADKFFREFVERAVDEVVRRVERYQLNIIILSGGFAESPYFQRVAHDRLGKRGRTIFVANDPTSKAVALGALKMVVGGERSMTVVRKPRPWPIWLTDFRKGLRELFGGDIQR